MSEVLQMTHKELDRIKILSRVIEGTLSQVMAGKMLDLSDRQVRNLLKRVKKDGDRGLISKKRGKTNHQISKGLKTNVLSLINNHYADFGPTLATEYLRDYHQINISIETIRKWMIEMHFWIPKQKKKKQHLLRERRRYFGELIQIDGSHHDWFEGRAPKCVLMVFIDDSTSTITGLHFAKSESLEAYFKTFEKHLKAYGVPLFLYGDRCSVLAPRCPGEEEDATQFQKAIKELNCKLLLATTPQAKGRVERVNRTLQDRLVKFLRVNGIDNIEEANLVLEEYRKQHNKSFSKKPSEQTNAHRPLDGIDLEQVLCVRRNRTLSKDFIIQFQNTFYLIATQDEKMTLYRGGKVEIRTCLNGAQKAFFKGKPVSMNSLNEVESPILNEKEIILWKPRKVYKPSKNHPFKRGLAKKIEYEEMLQNVV